MIPLMVVVTTYDRGDGSRTALAYKTLAGMQAHLYYPDIRWIVVDDGSPNAESNKQVLQGAVSDPIWFMSSEGKGVGYAKNIALKTAFLTSPYVLLLEDDWELVEDFDPTEYIQLMEEHKNVGMIRLGFLGGEMDAHYTDYGNSRSYWTLKRGSGVYIYSGQVSLRSQAFYTKVGWHPEGVDPGTEELEMCKHFNGVEGAPLILWHAKYGTTLNAGPFHNIGMGSSLNAEGPRA